MILFSFNSAGCTVSKSGELKNVPAFVSPQSLSTVCLAGQARKCCFMCLCPLRGGLGVSGTF